MNSDQLWDRYEAVLKEFIPTGYDALLPPATEIQIKEAEEAIGVRFPKELKEAYRRHDGTSWTPLSKKQTLFEYEGVWASLKDVVAYSKMKVHVNEASNNDSSSNDYMPEYLQSLSIKPCWWNDKWVPVGLTMTATSYCIDLSPGPKGTKGQLIYNSGDDVGGVLIAPGLNEWIEFLCDCFESGRFYTDAQTGEWFDKTRDGKPGIAGNVYYSNRK
jgi:cell wall assembly regulator SMI1